MWITGTLGSISRNCCRASAVLQTALPSTLSSFSCGQEMSGRRSSTATSAVQVVKEIADDYYEKRGQLLYCTLGLCVLEDGAFGISMVLLQNIASLCTELVSDNGGGCHVTCTQ